MPEEKKFVRVWYGGKNLHALTQDFHLEPGINMVPLDVWKSVANAPSITHMIEEKDLKVLTPGEGSPDPVPQP